MFTGIVEAMGEVVRVEPTPDGSRIWIRCPSIDDAEIGGSVALDGVCLTVTAHRDGATSFDVSPETLDRTTLGGRRAGDGVNVERPLRVGAELGGHMVQGHVDGVGTVDAVTRDADGVRVAVRVPGALSRYVVEKGSVTLDGVSLTVTEIEGDRLAVALIPHTLEVTTFGGKARGDRVNVEVDVLAKYVERLLEPIKHAAGQAN